MLANSKTPPSIRTVLILVTVLGQTVLFAQKEGVTPGIRIGATYGYMDGIAQTLIRDEWYPKDSYSTSERFRMRTFIGGYLDINPTKENWLRFETSVDYEHAWEPSNKDPLNFKESGNGDFEYVDWFDGNSANAADSLQYRLWLNYSYINVGFVTNLYFIGKDPILIGPCFGFDFGFNVSPKNITYRSNHPELGPDLQIQENISNVLRGRTAAWLIAGIGAHLGPIDLFARYRFGLNDLVTTEANSYNFIDNKNSAPVSWFFGAGYRIGDGIHLNRKAYSSKKPE